MLKVLITPPVKEYPELHRQHWFVAVKQDVPSPFGQYGVLFSFVCRPTERQIRRAKKQAKASFRKYLSQGGAA